MWRIWYEFPPCTWFIHVVLKFKGTGRSACSYSWSLLIIGTSAAVCCWMLASSITTSSLISPPVWGCTPHKTLHYNLVHHRYLCHVGCLCFWGKYKGNQASVIQTLLHGLYLNGALKNVQWGDSLQLHMLESVLSVLFSALHL